MQNDQTKSVIWGHVTAIGTCMMVTHSDNTMLARPMRGIIDEDENQIWFFSDRDTEKAHEFGLARGCCLTYSDVRGQTFVSLKGQLELVDDRHEVRRRWTEGAAVYFPRGADDEAVVLLRFTPESAAYWDAPSNPVVMAIKFLQAKATGKRPVLGTSESAVMS